MKNLKTKENKMKKLIKITIIDEASIPKKRINMIKKVIKTSTPSPN